MASYGQFCAIARSLDVLGERWTLLVVRELMLGSTSFGQIRAGLPRIPKATLATRLRALTKAGLVTGTDAGYQLTESGVALAPVLRELARWTVDTRGPLAAAHLDPVALTWDMQRRVNRAALPDRPVVLEIRFTDAAPDASRYWLHLSGAEVNLCDDDTGAQIDLTLTGPVEPVTRWWLGELSWTALARQPGVHLEGSRALQREMRHWFEGYLFTPERLRASTG
jgi:DNA-binding HxlR family transcriptional regulator